MKVSAGPILATAQPGLPESSHEPQQADSGITGSRTPAHRPTAPVTPDYGLDRERAVAVLNEALATELVCVLRYKFHYFMADRHSLDTPRRQSSSSTPTKSRSTRTRSPSASSSSAASRT